MILLNGIIIAEQNWGNLVDFVYIHDPTHKSSKARKFSYQYKGPFEIEQRISSLIYKVRFADGTFTIIHVNRLKEVHGQTENGNAPPLKQSISFYFSFIFSFYLYAIFHYRTIWWNMFPLWCWIVWLVPLRRRVARTCALVTILSLCLCDKRRYFRSA